MVRRKKERKDGTIKYSVLHRERWEIPDASQDCEEE